jgi:hemerythrin-like metal-binding protein
MSHAEHQGNLLIVWNESYMTGIGIIDEQHRGIVSITNSLHFAMYTRGDEDLLRSTAEMVMGYTHMHFKTEIEMLEESAYPRLKEHRAQHDHIIADGERIFQSCLKGGGDPAPFLDYLKGWFTGHIIHEDKAYSGHLLEYIHSPHRVITKR